MARLPCGTRTFEYRQDMAIVRTRLQWSLAVGLAILLIAAPVIVSSYWLTVIILMGIALIAVHGLNVLTGYAGQISLGQSAFVAVGAYTSGILFTQLNLPFLVCLLGAGIIAALVGVIFGLPSLRVKGFYLAIATLAAQFILGYVFMSARDLTGGPNGISIPDAQIGNFIFDTPQRYYYLVLVIVVIMTFLTKNLARTKAGRALVAVRDNDHAAEVMGVNLFHYKLLAFAICSFYAGIAGSLYGHYFGRILPDQFTLLHSIWYVGMIIVGGMGSVLGAILGTLSLSLLEEFIPLLSAWLSEIIPALSPHTSAALGLTLQGAVILGFLIYEPRGLAHRWEIIKNTYRVWPYKY